MPHRLRHRQQLLESRTEDRFSGALRVLAVTGRPRRDPRVSEARSDSGPELTGRLALLTPCRGIPVHGLGDVAVREGGIVDRPHGTQDRVSADAARRAAQRRSRRAASLARRGAAARRRGVLTLALLVLSVAGWVVVGLSLVAVVAAIVPTVALVGVLVLGRRAVVQGQVADAAWEHQRHAVGGAGRTSNPPVTGRAYRPSDDETQVIARIVVDDGATATGIATGTATGTAGDGSTSAARGAGAGRTTASTSAAAGDAAGKTAGGPDADGWSPVPVPRPTYTTKAAAPRREPIPLVLDEPVVPAAMAGALASDQDAPSAAEVATEAVMGTSTGAGTAPAGDAVGLALADDDNPTLDLDAILARRRAAG